MSADVWEFTSQVIRPDGVVVSASIQSPDRPDVQELAELAQMTASNGIRLLGRHDECLARRVAEEVAETTTQGPF